VILFQDLSVYRCIYYACMIYEPYGLHTVICITWYGSSIPYRWASLVNRTYDWPIVRISQPGGALYSGLRSRFGSRPDGVVCEPTRFTIRQSLETLGRPVSRC